MIDAELGIVPFDIRVRIEMFHHRLVAEPANQIGVGIGVDRFSNALLFRNNKLFGHQILQDIFFWRLQKFIICLTARSPCQGRSPGADAIMAA